MKNTLMSLAGGILLSACALISEPDHNWRPPVLVGEVGCCVTDVQVHGAIYSALLKRRWNIIDKTDNSFTAKIQCSGQPITVFFENTDAEYIIEPEQEIFDIYKYRSCIEENIISIDDYIQRYLTKAKKKAAKYAASNEMRGLR